MEEFLKFGRLKRGCVKIQGGAMAMAIVNHVIDHNASNGFITEDFTKLTALNRTFLSGKAAHLFFFCKKKLHFLQK